jgi:hypothetical protein
MDRITLLTGMALLSVGCATHVGCSGQSQQVVLDTEVRDYAQESKPSVSLDRVDHSTWDLNEQ